MWTYELNVNWTFGLWSGLLEFLNSCGCMCELSLKGREYFSILGTVTNGIKVVCVLCLFQLVIGITHFGVKKSTDYMLNPEPHLD